MLRVEDTDLERSTEDSVNAILDAMAWLGLDYDEGPFYQTQRFGRYNEVIDKLLDSGHAYRCACSKGRLEDLRARQMASRQKPRYDGHCRDVEVSPNQPHVVRFRNPLDGDVVIDDLIRGRIVVSNTELDDLIIRRTDGSPTYNLSVVVDDHDMGITHVIRGDDHINNTPRQINLGQAMGWPIPKFAHVPMILGDDGARLSKRHGAVGVMQYKKDGFLPEALLNYLVRLGWSHGDQELFSLEQMIDLFDLREVNRAPSAFNTEKLIWVNQQYIKIPVEICHGSRIQHTQKHPLLLCPVHFDRGKQFLEICPFSQNIPVLASIQYQGLGVFLHDHGKGFQKDLNPFFRGKPCCHPDHG